jgi:hypothetical protein
LLNNMEPDKLLSEARARIIWGESSLSVRDFLTSNGISETVADAKIKKFNLERSAELRRIGLRNTLIGVVLTGAAGGVIYWIFPSFSTSGSARVYGVLGVIGLYGLWKLVKGIIYLVRPQSEHRSIPDIVESDFID